MPEIIPPFFSLGVQPTMRMRSLELCRAGGVVILAVVMFVSATMIASGKRVFSAEPAQALFTPIDAARTDLNDKQALILSRIRQSKTTKDVKVAKLQGLPSQSADVPQVPLSLGVISDAFDMTAYKVLRGDSGGALEGHGSEPPQSVTLAWTPEGNGCAGLIYSGKQVYSVQPLGNGLQAVVQLDQSKFSPDHPPAFDKLAEGVKNRKLPKPKAPSDASAPPVVFTALVAYTPRVNSNVGDIQAVINGAVAVANSTYTNSRVNLHLDLVHTVEVDYTESGSHEMDLAHFRDAADGQMDNVHQLRDEYKADVCVLLIDNSQYCGLAAAILASSESAFAVVHYECAVGNLSFAHEIGHLQGARHNLEVDPTLDPTYPWNHGYLIPGTDGRTVMAYPSGENPKRIANWSNPSVKYMGVPTGTADKQNNALMLNDSADVISQFR